MKNTKKSITFYDISSNGNTFLLCPEEKDLKYLFDKEIINIADGIILLSPSLTSSAHFIIYNKDGSRAPICGNGLLASTFYLSSILKREEKEFLFLTDSGYFKTLVNENSFSLLYPLPKIISLKEDGAIIDAFNLHYVQEVNKINPEDLIKQKEALNMPINLHQLKEDSLNHYSYVSLENGVGFTSSCLSGAASVYAYLNKSKGTKHKISLSSLGGLITLELKDSNLIEIKGKVKLLFKGQIYE